VLRRVVGDAVFEPRVVDSDLPPVTGQVEAEEIAAGRQRRGRSGEEVVRVLRPERTAAQEA
jgi:hypothetical protein